MPYTILVIDDQWSMQEYTRFVLQTAGHRVLLAGETVTGLSLARTEHPDAIIMDERLRSRDMLLALRQDSHTATIPVILITLSSSKKNFPPDQAQVHSAPCKSLFNHRRC